MLPEDLKNKILAIQRTELSEQIIYKQLALIVKDSRHREILEQISQEEFRHYEFFKGLTHTDVRPDRLKILFYVTVARLFGLNFGLKLMEAGEDLAQETYERLKTISNQIEKIIYEEETHERQLIDLIDEERLKYVSSVVLGLNDALVELSGALVGFTLALQNTRLVGIVGLITGIAASLSMAASEYLSTKHEETEKNPLKASIYTGISYIGTVAFLIMPYLIFENIYLCLGWVLLGALLAIFVFTYYISVAKGFVFKRRFLEMAGISLGVAFINFIIGLAVRKIFGIEA